MVMKISTEIIDYIRNSGYDEETQNFLIQALMLEFKRDKEDLKNYFKKYDNLINSFVK